MDEQAVIMNANHDSLLCLKGREDKMATALQLLLLAAACALVPATGDSAHAPRPALAAGPDRAFAPAGAATARDDVIQANAPPRPHLRAPATAPRPSSDLEGLGWTPAHANGTAAGGGDTALGRHRRGAWAC